MFISVFGSFSLAIILEPASGLVFANSGNEKRLVQLCFPAFVSYVFKPLDLMIELLNKISYSGEAKFC